jgi:hypothetical protein
MDDIGIEMFVKSPSMTTQPRSVSQAKKDEIEIKAHARINFKKYSLANQLTHLVRMVVLACPSR